jgi:hypothetical protein
MVTLSSFPFSPTKPNMLIKPKGFSITLRILQEVPRHVDRIKTCLQGNDVYRERIEQTTENESIEHLSKPGTPSDRADSNSRGGERSDVFGKIVQNLQLASGEDSSSSQPQEGQSGASTTGGGTGAGDSPRHSSSDSSMASDTSAETTPNKAKRNSNLYFRFFAFFAIFRSFHFFSLFSLNFRFASIFFA